ncbi:hypothetical protein F8388_002050 [Cannabis sativa]|uniref:F-box domain-containing protein n=1 Tax=Cannabis sativa TaxID=3483 RepID=A0A7J6DRZ5_CANSA|nr:hypothetical protein F8388_002050 [Cannabis sativa]KAF4375350.1 hypothetical protein G4B88_022016 [Cannabis sativa]
MDELPEDIIVIIFSNLDVKTLLSLRFTCRQWHQIISGSSFGRQLAEKQNLKKGVVQQPMLLIFYHNHNPSSSDDDHHRILNPNPNPNNKDERVLEIDLNLFPWPNWHSNNNKDPLLFQCCANDSNWIQLITKLSLQPHRYVPMGYPTWIDKEGVFYWLVDLNYGVLSLVHYTSSNNIKIWNLIKDDEEEIWVQKYKIKIRTTLIQDSWPYMPNYHNPKHSYVHMKSWDSYSHHPYEVIGPWENDEVLIRYLTGTFMAYNLNTKTFKKLNLPPIDSNCFAYSYFPNLVSVSWIQDQQLLGI